ncbi:MAG: Ig-like domain repeat protein, partial [Candidatus Coatesbacteria bacterium]|nr:Ig-like domain repeat protein [Candidatus Coatesbacteria bacterium]
GPSGDGDDSTIYDLTAPVSSCTSPQYAVTTLDVNFTAADTDGSGVYRTYLYYRYESGSWTNYDDKTGESGTFSFTPSDGEGTYYFQTVAQDNAGNTESGPSGDGDDSTIYDATGPSSSCTSPTYCNASTIDVDFNASDSSGSGVYRTDLYYRYESGSWTNYGYETGESGAFSFTASNGQGTYYFQTIAQDNAGNTESGPSGNGDDSTTYDATPPSSSCSSPTYSANSTINVSFNSSDISGSGLYRTYLYYKYGSGSWTNCDYETGESGTFIFTASDGEGTYYFQTVAEDNAGNTESGPSGDADDSTIYDLTAPVSSCTSPQYAVTTLDVNFTASDTDGSGVYRTGLYYKHESGSWTHYDDKTGESGTFSFTPADGEGTYYFQTIAQDNAGNTESGPSGYGDDSTVYDATPPSSGCSSPTYSASSTINVNFNSSDTGGSGLYRTSLYCRYESGSWTNYGYETGESGAFSFAASNGEGTYYFQTIAQDNAGNTESGPSGDGDDSTTYDVTPPSSSCSAPTYSANSTINVSFNASDTSGSGLYRTYLYYKYGSGSWTYSNYSSQSTGAFSFTASLGEGKYYFQTIAEDNAGNSESGPSGNGDDSSIYDRTAPCSSCTSPTASNSSAIDVNFNASDTGGSGIYRTRLYYRYESSSWTSYDYETGSSGTFCFVPSHGNGTYYFQTIAEDNAGNTESGPTGEGDDSTLYDVSAPYSSCSSPGSSNSPAVSIGFSASDTGGSGLYQTHLYYRFGSGSWTDCDQKTESSGTFSFTASDGEGVYYFQTIAEDRAGNLESGPSGNGDDSTVYDATAPYSRCVSPEYANSSPIVVNFDADDAVSGIASVVLWYNWGGQDWKDAGLSESGTSGSFGFEPVDGEGTYEFYTIATDEVGNVESPPGTGDDSTIYDTRSPISSCSSPDYANSSPIPVSFTASDPESGVAHVDLWYSYKGGDWTDSELSENSDSGTFNFSPTLGLGTYEFYTIATNNAGNSEGPPQTADDCTTYDTEAPASSCESPQYGNSSYIVVSFAATDPLSGVASTALWFNWDGHGWTDSGLSEGGTSGAIDFECTEGEGPYEFYTVATDNAGNVESAPAAADDETLHDISPPESSCASVDYANSSPIVVSFDATDALSGIASTALWFNCGGSGWVDSGMSETGAEGSFDFEPTHGDGVYAFYTLSTDNAGNVEIPPEVSDAETVYDTQWPESSCTSPENANSSPVTVSFTASDDLSGITAVELWYNYCGEGWTDSGLSESGVSGSFDFGPAQGDGTYTFYTIAIDGAGNVESAPETADDETVYNTQSPVSSCTGPENANFSPIAPSFTASDPLSGIASVALWYRYSSEGWTDTGLSESGTSGSFDFELDDGEGLYEFYTIATNNAGTVENAPKSPDFSTVFDLQSPESSCSSTSYGNSSPLAVCFTASDSLSGIASTDLWINYNGQGWTDCGLSESGTSGGFDFEPAQGDGVYEFYTIATDNAGNTESAPEEMDDETVFDTQSPTSTCTTIHCTRSSPIAVGFVAKDTLSGTARTDLWYNHNNQGWADSGLSESGTSGSLDFEPADGDGVYEFFTVSTDVAGNAEDPPQTAQDETVYDTQPPISHCGSPENANSLPIAVSFTAEDTYLSVTSVALWYNYNSQGWTDSELSESGTSGSFEFEPTHGDGLYEFCTIGVDEAGNIESIPQTADDATAYDTLRPESSCACVHCTQSSPIAVSFTASDGLAGVASVALWYSYSGQDWTDSGLSESATSGSLDFEPTQGDGVYEFYTIATDRAGNVEKAPGHADALAVYDTQRPSSSCTSPQYASFGTISVFYSAHDALASITSVALWYQFDEGGWTDSGLSSSSAVGTFCFPATCGDGCYNFYTIGTDAAGWSEEPPVSADSATVCDSQGPSSACHSQDFSSSTTISVQFTASDELSGLASVDLYFKGPETDFCFWATSTDGTLGTFQFTATVQGSYQFSTVAHDRAGNTETHHSGPDTETTFDCTPPVSQSRCEEFASSRPMEIAYDAHDELSGIDVVQLFAREASGEWSLVDTDWGASSGILLFNPSSEGIYEFATVARDGAGNEEDLSSSAHCTCGYDVSVPSSTCSSPRFSSESPILITFAADDAIAQIESIELFFREGSAGDWVSYSAGEAGAAGVLEFVPPSEGHFEFYTIATDRAGNKEHTPQMADSWTLYDQTPPTSSCIAPDYASGESIEILFEAEDALSSVSSVTIYCAFNHGPWVEAWGPTMVSVGSFEFVPLLGDGIYEFFVSASDLCGNVWGPSEPQCSMLYDTSTPVASCWSAASFVIVPSIQIDYSANDEASGVESVAIWYRYKEGAWRHSGLEESRASGTITFTPTDGDGLYCFYCAATDRAGNESACPGEPDCQVVVDCSMPGLSNGHVSPQVGTVSDVYDFTVSFLDKDGEPPSVSDVIIDAKPFSMGLISGSPANGNYKHSTHLAAGSHEFYFRFEDAYGLGVSLPDTGALRGPDVDTPCALSDGSVNPEIGDTQTLFEFRVRFTDVDGDTVSKMTCVIDGEAFDMQPATRKPNSAEYVCSTQLSIRDHGFYFLGKDSKGVEARLPAAGQFSGPTVNESDTEPPYITEMNPREGASNVNPNTTIMLRVLDNDSGVDRSTIRLWVAGLNVEPDITSGVNGFTLTYAPTKAFSQNMVVRVEVSACDNASTPNCFDHSGYEFTVGDRVAPLITRSPVLADVGSHSAIIQWLTNERANSLIEYYAEGGTHLYMSSSSMVLSHSIELRDLAPSERYHFRVASTDLLGNGPTFSSWHTFDTLLVDDNTLPSVLTGPAAAGVSSNCATIIWTTDKPTAGFLSYGPVGMGSSLFVERDYTRDHSALLQDLQQDTEYECVLTCKNTSDIWSTPSTLYFATSHKPDVSPPTILEGPEVIHLNATIAVVGWRTDEFCEGRVEYGEGNVYGNTAVEPRPSIVHEVYLSDLSPGTEYHYRVLCTDLLGNGPSVSYDSTFVTLSQSDESGLFCTSGPDVTYVTDSEAKIEWTTDKVSDSEVVFWLRDGVKGAQTETRVWRDGAVTRDHGAFLTGLEPGSAYSFMLSSRDPTGNALPSRGIGTFATEDEADSSSPTISDVGTSYNACRKVRIDWQTSEPGDARILYWKRGSKQIGKDSWAGGENAMQHSGWLVGLEGYGAYEYQVGSSDASGNISWSEEQTFDVSAEEDVSPPSFTYGPTVESDRGFGAVTIAWGTDEIADTLLEHWKQNAIELGKCRWASYKQGTSHRVELAGLMPGTYEFEARSKDPAGNASLTKGGTFTISGSESGATLSNPHVVPSSGSQATMFTYSVNYRGPTLRGPIEANVIIDGSCTRPMSLTEGQPYNGVYAHSTLLGAGTHTFRFELKSATGQEVTAPDSGDYYGPRVSAESKFHLDLRANETLYAPGEVQTLFINAVNTGGPRDVDFYLHLSKPDGSIAYWPTSSPDPIPIPILPFPGNTSFTDFELFSEALDTDLPPGEYSWNASLCEHNTQNQLCAPARESFTISAHQCEINLELNDTEFAPGDELALKALISNPDEQVEADLLVRINLPGDLSVYLPDYSASPTPMELSIPAMCEDYELEILRVSLPAGIPAGQYEVVGALYLRGSSEALSNQSDLVFELFNVRVTMATNGSSFRPDDRLIASASIWNFGPDIDLDLCIALMLPDGLLLFLPSFDADPTVYYALRPLAEGTEWNDLPVMDATIPPGLMVGDYCFFAAFFEADSPSLHGKFCAVCWELRE